MALLQLLKALLLMMIFIVPLLLFENLPDVMFRVFTISSNGALFLTVNVLIFALLASHGCFSTPSTALVVHESTMIAQFPRFSFITDTASAEDESEEQLGMITVLSSTTTSVVSDVCTSVVSEVCISEEHNLCREIVPVPTEAPSSPISPRRRKKKRLARKNTPPTTPKLPELTVSMDDLSIDDFNDAVSNIIKLRSPRHWQLR